jgi:hypothetical protein
MLYIKELTKEHHFLWKEYELWLEYSQNKKNVVKKYFIYDDDYKNKKLKKKGFRDLTTEEYCMYNCEFDDIIGDWTLIKGDYGLIFVQLKNKYCLAFRCYLDNENNCILFENNAEYIINEEEEELLKSVGFEIERKMSSDEDEDEDEEDEEDVEEDVEDNADADDEISTEEESEESEEEIIPIKMKIDNNCYVSLLEYMRELPDEKDDTKHIIYYHFYFIECIFNDKKELIDLQRSEIGMKDIKKRRKDKIFPYNFNYNYEDYLDKNKYYLFYNDNKYMAKRKNNSHTIFIDENKMKILMFDIIKMNHIKGIYDK